MRNFVLFCLYLPSFCFAVESYTPSIADPLLEPWRWRHEEALDGMGVFCMDEGADGGLWFGNTGSIAHYDGVTVTKIPFDDALLEQIKFHKRTPRAKALTVLPSGDLLILIGESLVLRRNGGWKVLLKDAGRAVFTGRMKQATDGTIWLVLPKTLWRISKDLTETSVVMEAAPTGFLGTFCFDSDGNLWIPEKVNEQLARLVKLPIQDGTPAPKSEWSDYPVPFDTDADEIHIMAGPGGTIWYADDSPQTSLMMFHPEDRKWAQQGDHSPKMRLFSLSKGSDGTMWACGGGNILRTPPRGKQVFYTNEQLQLPHVPLSLYKTSRRLWVIGRVGYVYSVDTSDTEWKTYERLNFECESQAGKLWFRSKNRDGVVVHDPSANTWVKYDLSDGLIDSVFAINSSSHSLTWATGKHEGRAAIGVFDGESWTRFLHPGFATFIEPMAVVEAGDGTMWFGAGGSTLEDLPNAGGALQYGVDKQNHPYLIKHHKPPNLPYYITSLSRSADDTIHIGSTVYHQYDPKTQSAPVIAAHPGMNTIDIVFDQQQNIWLAKQHAGIYRQLPDSSWKLYSTPDGLAGLTLSDLLILTDGTLLAASGGGISRFDGKSWTTHAFPSHWAMSDRWSGMHQSSDSSLWFNSTYRETRSAQAVVNGTERFLTIRYRAEKVPPDTQITDYLTQVAQPGNTHIEWSAHDPWSSTLRENLQFSWRLDGGEWSAFTQEKGRTFLDLPSGQHALKVRARDRAFNVDPTPATIQFTVIPPIWQQTWFIVLISIFVGVIVLLIWIMMQNREKYLLGRQATREAFLLEQQKEREEYLEEIDRLKTGFFTNISHELRTPLTVISGRLEVMRSTEMDEQKKRALSIVLRNAQRLSNLVTQLLDLRKIEEDKLTVTPAHGDIVPLLQECVVSLQMLAEDSQISCKLTSIEQCVGQFDFDKLEKIFTNIISNAVKYSNTGGQVLVTLQLEESTPGMPQIQFIVEDNGVGIQTEHLEHIFDRFYRVPGALPTVGTGVGLNLTKELVDLLGGSIKAESPIHPDSKHPGTRFTILLPIRQEDQTEASDLPTTMSVQARQPAPIVQVEKTDQTDKADQTDTTNQSNETPLLLVVEDDDDIRSFIRDGMQSIYRVETAPNGQLGLGMARELVPDVIITDLMMPEMEGTEMCHQLKTTLETSHIPVIMLTAKASIDHQLEGLKTGADDYITKPFHMELLQARVANLLESRRLLREKFCQEYSPLALAVPKDLLEQEFLENIMIVLEEHYTEWDFKADQFASAMHMSIRSLQRKLKAVTDRTPKEFINEFRMARAAERLLQSNDTITEITFQIGMEEPTNFSRMFKSHYEMTPTQYRAKHRSD